MRTRRLTSSSDPMPVHSASGETKPSGHRPSVHSEGVSSHIPVLLHEVVGQLHVRPDDILVDATLGGGGHTAALAEKLGPKGILIGFDLDIDAIARAKKACAKTEATTHFVQTNFRYLVSECASRGVTHITKALFDLGWSSYQLDSGRGFSFLKDEPLAMTFEKAPAGDTLTADTIVNAWAENSIADVLYGWGQERYARRIARAIVERRVKKPFTSALDLAETIKRCVPVAYRHGRIHPATRTFQALRIAVNDELGALKEGVEGAWRLLVPGGIIAVITFHSIEDRIVKQLFQSFEQSGEGKRVTKKPIVASTDELERNPRSRSAKLRVIQKLFATNETQITQNKQVRTLGIPGEN